jgi:MscS family membrane protein
LVDYSKIQGGAAIMARHFIHNSLQLLAYVLLVATSCATTALCQEPETSDPAQTPAIPTVDPELAKQLASPADTIRTFVTAVNENDLDLAAKCLDVSQIVALEEVKNQTAKDYALQLKNGVLDKMFRIDYSVLPTKMPKDIDKFTMAEVIQGIQDHVLTDVTMIQLSRGEDDLWRFSAETVEVIPELWQRWHNQENVVLTTENKSEQSVGRKTQELFFRDTLLRNPWIAGFVIVCVGIIVHWIVCTALGALTRLWFRVRHGDTDASTYQHVWRPIGLCLQSAIWYWGVNYVLLDTRSELFLNLGIEWAAYLRSASVVLLRAICVITAVWTLFGFINLGATFWARRAVRTVSKFDDMLIPLVSRTLKIVAICAGVLTIAQTFDLPLTGLFGAMGIGAMALALASQDAVSNLFGTATVLIDHPFEIGDWIKTDGVEGTVEAVGFRSTRIRTFYNSLITLPNSRLTTAIVDNLGKRQYRRITATLGIQYDSTPEQIDAFCEGIREIVRRHPYTRKDYYHVYLNGFGDSALEVMLYCFVECPDWSVELREKHRLYVDIMRLAEKLGVQFAFPTQTLHMFKEERDPDAVPNISDPLQTGQQHARSIAGALLDEKHRPGLVEFPNPGEDRDTLNRGRGSTDDDG